MSEMRAIILGAAGRDFHNFNVVYRQRSDIRIAAFTAAQIPEIDDRRYPPSLSGPLYPEGIPIVPEDALEEVIAREGAREAIFSYSDVSFEHLGHVASRVNAAGARFVMLPPSETAIPSRRPVISVCAVRTGSGKSQTSRHVARLLRDAGRRVAIVRHPMPYGDLGAQAVQVFRNRPDMDAAGCTIEEREEYEHYTDQGFTVYAGVDYGAILERAEASAEVVLWDGGNNDTSFYESDLHIVVLDPLRAGHELRYHPGMTNLITADVIVVNKVDQASDEQVGAVLDSARRWAPKATVIRARSRLDVSEPERVRGKRVLCVEDGPTLTHGEMSIGAAWVAATRLGAEVVDPRPYAVGSIAKAYEKYPHLGPVVPALGYYAEQLRELEQTLENADVDTVVVGTPIDLSRILAHARPMVRVTYALDEVEGQAVCLADLVHGVLG